MSECRYLVSLIKQNEFERILKEEILRALDKYLHVEINTKYKYLFKKLMI